MERKNFANKAGFAWSTDLACGIDVKCVYIGAKKWIQRVKQDESCRLEEQILLVARLIKS